VWLCAAVCALFAASACGDTIGTGNYASWQWHGVSWTPLAGATTSAASSTPSSESSLSLATSALSGESTTGQTYSYWQWHGVSYSSSSASSGTLVAATASSYTISADPFVGDSGTASLSGYIYVDANDNHVMDTSDWAIAGAQVTLTAAGSSTAVAAVLSAQNGSYSFSGLAAGTYTLTMSTSTNHPGQDSGASRAVLDADEQAVSLTDTVEQNAYAGITLGDGDIGTNFNFAELTYPGSLISKAMLLTSSSPVIHTGNVVPATPVIIVPEPRSLLLLAVLGLFLAGARWRRKTRGPAA
jgi:hypothetical protein